MVLRGYFRFQSLSILSILIRVFTLVALTSSPCKCNRTTPNLVGKEFSWGRSSHTNIPDDNNTPSPKRRRQETGNRPYEWPDSSFTWAYRAVPRQGLKAATALHSLTHAPRVIGNRQDKSNTTHRPTGLPCRKTNVPSSPARLHLHSQPPCVDAPSGL